MRKSFIFIQILCLDLLASSATARVEGYKDSVYEICRENKKYQNFRQDRYIMEMYEHVTDELGMKFYSSIIEKYPNFLKNASLLEKNDRVGNPRINRYPFFGMFCPTTLRYIYFLGEIQDLFNLQSGCKIAEIGCGYGGQCAIISRLINFSCYEIIDLDFTLPLTERYLKDVKVDNFITSSMQNCGKCDEYDLLISNYAISECDKAVQINYIDKIASVSKRGYIAYNYIPNVTTHVHTIEEFCDLLRAKGINPQIREETIQTNANATNYLIYWGADN
ncbi:MAG: hypothetical protein S4CHLAM20_11300 [Chlamydiia bacterium]|nr:hypothetical protein [Chlamydiia bacterium]